jgi:hypothetical protein
MGSLLFFLGGKNIVYPLWQSSFVKVSGNQIKIKKDYSLVNTMAKMEEYA